MYQIRYNWVDNVECIYKHQLLRTIDPDKGMGSALLEYLLKKNQNSRLLVVDRMPRGAIRFHIKFGFILHAKEQSILLLKK